MVFPIPYSRVVKASDSGALPVALVPELKDLIIKQVQFADGTSWEHPKWDSIVLLTRQGIKKRRKGKCGVL